MPTRLSCEPVVLLTKQPSPERGWRTLIQSYIASMLEKQPMREDFLLFLTGSKLG